MKFFFFFESMFCVCFPKTEGSMDNCHVYLIVFMLVVTGNALSPNDFSVCRRGHSVDVKSYGAVGDGVTLDNNAFAKAIAAVNRLPQGGCVTVFNGSYVVAGIHLLSKVHLYIDLSATILGSLNYHDYPWTCSPPVNSSWWVGTWWVVGARGQSDVGIVGEGTIDGQSMKNIDFYNATSNQLILRPWGPQNNSCTPPSTVRFVSCSDVYVGYVHLQNSMQWTSHYLGCQNVLVEYVTVQNNIRLPENDGIDPDSSINVTIRHCNIHGGDDGISPKSTLNFGPLRNVYVHNVSIVTRSCGIKIGASTPENMSNLLFEDIHILPETHRALGIQHRDAGNISNVTFRNVFVNYTQYWPNIWWGAAEPIWFSVAQRTAGAPMGHLSNVLVENVIAIGENGVVISGYHEVDGPQTRQMLRIHNILLRNISITVARRGNYTQPSRDYRPTFEPSMKGKRVHGIFIEFAEGVVVLNSSFSSGLPQVTNYEGCIKTGELTPGLGFSNVQCED